MKELNNFVETEINLYPVLIVNERILYEKAEYICHCFQQENVITLFVGGFVRNALLRLQGNINSMKDIDICVNCNPSKIRDIAKKYNLKTLDDMTNAAQFGMVMIRYKNESFELTMTRSDQTDVDSKNSRKDTSVKPGTFLDDTMRRDFTCNNIYYDPITQIMYSLGTSLVDIESKQLKCVGNAKNRMNEDKIRALRAIRFAAKYGFTIENKTYNALIYVAKNHLLQNCSIERVREEFMHILLSSSDTIRNGIEMLHETELLQDIIPELDKLYGLEQHNPHHIYDVFHHNVEACAISHNLLQENNYVFPEVKSSNTYSISVVTLLASLFHDIGKTEDLYFEDEDGVGHFYQRNEEHTRLHQVEGSDLARVILERMKFSKVVVDIVCLLIEKHMNVGMKPLKLIRQLSIHGYIDSKDVNHPLNAFIMLLQADNLSGKLNQLEKGVEEYIKILRNSSEEFKTKLEFDGHRFIEDDIPLKQRGIIQKYLQHCVDCHSIENTVVLLSTVYENLLTGVVRCDCIDKEYLETLDCLQGE